MAPLVIEKNTPIPKIMAIAEQIVKSRLMGLDSIGD
jgi:hypothetical protein